MTYSNKISLDIKNIRYNEPMREHTSFKVGGSAEVFIEPQDTQELIKTIKYLKEHSISYYIIGNGSNLLVSDKGIKGAVVQIAERFNNIHIDGEEITAESGMLLSTLSKAAAKKNLTGLEFASGIPGTLGGAMTMNAGAYGGEMKDIVRWVEVLDEKLELKRLDNSQMKFGYRKSIIESMGYIVLRCNLKLNNGEPEKISELMSDLANRRKTKQPLHLPSAGSTFKRPEGYFAGKLIEDSGLKGFQIGGAQVSTLHSGFVVNTGEAAAADIYNLIRHIQKVVYDKYNVKLETEVKLLGEF